jgi:hypothetical protein
VTKEEADRIFGAWQAYLETADRFSALMLKPPESFLPYPVDALKEASNIVAKRFFDAGDFKTSESIQSLIAFHLGGYFTSEVNRRMTDEEALVKMREQLDLILRYPDLMKALLEKLKESQQSWMERRMQSETKPVPLSDREAADKFFKDDPVAAFDIAMGQHGALSIGFLAAVYAKVCEEIEKAENFELITDLMNSLDNMDLSAEAQKRGYRHREQAIEAGKEVRKARVKAFEKNIHRQAYPGVLDRFANTSKSCFNYQCARL